MPYAARFSCSPSTEALPVIGGIFCCSGAGAQFFLRLLETCRSLREGRAVSERLAHHAIESEASETASTTAPECRQRDRMRCAISRGAWRCSAFQGLRLRGVVRHGRRSGRMIMWADSAGLGEPAEPPAQRRSCVLFRQMSMRTVTSSIERPAIGSDSDGHQRTVKTIIGHTLGHESAQPLPLSRMPRTSRLKYVSGSRLPITCAHPGMPLNGNMNPESKILGRK